MSAEGEAVFSGAGRSFADQDEEKWCQGRKTSADDAEADFDARPECREGTRVWDR